MCSWDSINQKLISIHKLENSLWFSSSFTDGISIMHLILVHIFKWWWSSCCLHVFPILFPKCKVAWWCWRWWWWGSVSDPRFATSAALPKNSVCSGGNSVCYPLTAIFPGRQEKHSSQPPHLLCSHCAEIISGGSCQHTFFPLQWSSFKASNFEKRKKRERERGKKNQVMRSQPIVSHPSWTGSAPARFCHQ